MHHPRITHHGKRLLTALAGVSVIGLSSCETLQSTKQPPRILASVPTRSVSPKKPGGGVYPPLRVSRFVFHADAPLNQDDVIFRELETLPEQIERELQVPTGTNLIQVYLFTTQDHYEAYMADRHPDFAGSSCLFRRHEEPTRDGRSRRVHLDG